MDASIADFIQEVTTTSGTTQNIALTAVTGYGRFADAFATDETVYYVIRDGANCELGIGTVKAGNTLDRAATPLVTVVAGVYDNTSPVRITLSGNEAIVACAASAVALLDAEPAIASLAQAEAGTDNTVVMTPLRTAQAIRAIPHKNYLINGNFDIWQRGTSQTSIGYGSDDRWSNLHNGSTKTHSQQSFTLGQTDVPNEPEFFSRTVVTSVANTSNYVFKVQSIEDVRTLAGQTATISFWAKADSAKNIAVEITQNFGTGGSPSPENTGNGAQLYALTTSWQKFSATISIPSISGKTLGTSGNDWVGVLFWFDAGLDYATRTAFLGQQSGTFDIAQVQLEKGSVATDFEQRSIGEERFLCERYYQRWSTTVVRQYNTAGATSSLSITNRVPMRTTPSTSVLAAPDYINSSGFAIEAHNDHSHTLSFIVSSTGTGYIDQGGDYSLEAEL